MIRAHSKIRRACLVTTLAAAGVTIAMLLIMLLRLPDRFQGLKRGDFLPDARLVSPQGEPVDTRSWRGRPTLLLLFDPSCPACLNELDNIEALAPTMPGLRVALLSVSPPDTREPRFAAYHDPTGELIRSARRFAVPALYWIGPDGRIDYARSGARSFPEDAAIFNALLRKQD